MKKNRKQNACNLLIAVMVVMALAIIKLPSSNHSYVNDADILCIITTALMTVTAIGYFIHLNTVYPLNVVSYFAAASSLLTFILKFHEGDRMFIINFILLEVQFSFVLLINFDLIRAVLKREKQLAMLKREEYRNLRDFKKYFQTDNVFIEKNIPIRFFNKGIIRYWKTFLKDKKNLYIFDTNFLYNCGKKQYLATTATGWRLLEWLKASGYDSITIVMYEDYYVPNSESHFDELHRKLVIITDRDVNFINARAPLGQVIDEIEVNYIPKAPVRK